jgi:hypothetical protein
MEGAMASPAFTVRVFGIYLLGLGAILVVAPNALLGLFGLPPTREIWIHVAGMLTAFLGVYYVRAAAAGLSAFFGWTVPVRLSVVAVFAAFVALLSAPPTLLLFGLVDAAGAIWTWRALRAGPR